MKDREVEISMKRKWYLSFGFIILLDIIFFPIAFILSLIRLLSIKNQEKGYKIQTIILAVLNFCGLLFLILLLIPSTVNSNSELVTSDGETVRKLR